MKPRQTILIENSVQFYFFDTFVKMCEKVMKKMLQGVKKGVNLSEMWIETELNQKQSDFLILISFRFVNRKKETISNLNLGNWVEKLVRALENNYWSKRWWVRWPLNYDLIWLPTGVIIDFCTLAIVIVSALFERFFPYFLAPLFTMLSASFVRASSVWNSEDGKSVYLRKAI